MADGTPAPQDRRAGQVADDLRTRGHAALVAFNNALNSFLEANTVFALSGFKSIGESAAIVFPDARLVLLVTPAWDAGRARTVCPDAEVIGSDALAESLAAVAAANELNARNAVAVALQNMGQDFVAHMDAALDGRLPDAGTLVSQAARIRNAREVAAVARASAIAEKSLEHLLDSARTGMREYQLAAELYMAAKALGADDNFLLMSASLHNRSVRTAGNRRIERGDVILAEITPAFDGQFAQICRTVVVGEPTGAQRDNYALLKRAMQAGQAAAVPGARVCDVVRAMNRPVEEAGYGDYCRPPHMRVRGHALGITTEAPGNLTIDNETVLEEGMVFVMHPNQYLPGSGYLLCGETVTVRPHGAESMSAVDAELISIEG